MTDWCRRVVTAGLMLAGLAVAGRPLAGVAEEPPGSSAWPQFRGPTGQGTADWGDAPVTWSETENVAWRTRIPGNGWSSPVVSGGQVWLTSATESGRSLRAICVDAETGKLLRNIKVFDVDRPGGVHPKNGHASPTPILDGDRVFVHFGANGTACLDRSGEILWKRTLTYYHHHGSGGSPVLVDGVLVIICDGMTGPFYDKLQRPGVEVPQFIVGLDADTGEIRWKTPRRGGRHAYCTPLAVEVEGRTQVVAPGGDHVWAYDPRDGRELWQVRYVGYSVIPRPVSAAGRVFVCTGYDTGSLLAIRPGGTGDVTATHVDWRLSQGVPFTPSAVIVGGHIHLLTDNGILSAVECDTGAVAWKQRLGGNCSASLTAIGDRLYCQAEDGATHVVQAGAKFARLAVNRVRGRTFASLACANGRLYLRSDRHLYCLSAGSRSAEEPDAPSDEGGK